MDQDYISQSLEQEQNNKVFDDIDSWTTFTRDNFGEFFGVLFLNIRSIKKHFDEFLCYIENSISNLNVLILAEVNISEWEFEMNRGLFFLNDYGCVEKLRTNRAGGGIMVYYKNNISVCQLHADFKHCELLSLELKFNDISLLLIAVYRPPNADALLFLEELDAFLRGCTFKNVIFIGDINIDTTKFGAVSDAYENLMSKFGFMKKISTYTREESRNGIMASSCLDHLYCRSRNINIAGSTILAKISDHYMLAGAFKCSTTEEIRYNRKQNSYDQGKFGERLNQLLTETAVNSFTNVDDLYDYLVDSYTAAREYSKLASYRTNRRNSKIKPWMTVDIVSDIKNRDKAYRIWKRSTETNQIKETLRLRYVILRNKINTSIRKAKRNYYEFQFQKYKNNMKKIWQHINEVMGRSSKSTAKITSLDKDVSQTLDGFASFFSDIPKNISHNCSTVLFAPYMKERGQICEVLQRQSFSLPFLCEQEYNNLICKISDKKSTGMDGISVTDIRNHSEEFKCILINLINLSIHTGVFPEKLKLAVVTPIYKGGVKGIYDNYRPISVLSVIDKIIERFIADKLYDYLHKYDVLGKNQFGFIKNRGTISALELVADCINEKLDNGKHVLCMFIDLRKAFDSINHDEMVLMLHKIGVRGSILSWFSSYLKNRKLVVKFGERLSASKTITRGVPQGSVLGPLLYLIYVNDVQHCFTKCKHYLYADDTLVVSAHKDFNLALNNLKHDFFKFQLWAHDKKLSINLNKTNIMYIASPHNRLSCNIKLIAHTDVCLHIMARDGRPAGLCHCKPLPIVKQQKYLGLTIDDSFLWSTHINELHKKLKYFSCCFYYLSNIVPQHILLLIYHSLIESILSYGIVVWGSASFCHINRLQLTQNVIVRNINKTIQDANNAYKKHKILKIEELYMLRVLINNYFNPQITTERQHPYKTRAISTRELEVPRCANKYGQRQRQVVVPRLLNKLPGNLRNLQSLREVKARIKDWLIYK